MKNYKIICLLINPKHMEETLLAMLETRCIETFNIRETDAQ